MGEVRVLGRLLKSSAKCFGTTFEARSTVGADLSQGPWEVVITRNGTPCAILDVDIKSMDSAGTNMSVQVNRRPHDTAFFDGAAYGLGEDDDSLIVLDHMKDYVLHRLIADLVRELGALASGKPVSDVYRRTEEGIKLSPSLDDRIDAAWRWVAQHDPSEYDPEAVFKATLAEVMVDTLGDFSEMAATVLDAPSDVGHPPSARLLEFVSMVLAGWVDEVSVPEETAG